MRVGISSSISTPDESALLNFFGNATFEGEGVLSMTFNTNDDPSPAKNISSSSMLSSREALSGDVPGEGEALRVWRMFQVSESLVFPAKLCRFDHAGRAAESPVDGAGVELERLELVLDLGFVEDGRGIEGPKKSVAELLLSILFMGGRGRRGAGCDIPLIRRRGRGDPASEEDERAVGEPQPRCANEGKATVPLCLGRDPPIRQGMPDGLIDCITMIIRPRRTKTFENLLSWETFPEV